MNAKVMGLGVWVPETIRKNSDWPAEFRGRATKDFGSELAEIGDADEDACDRIVAGYLKREADDPFRGTTERRVADDSMLAAEAEARAATSALADAGVDASDIDYVLSWAMVPDSVTPPSGPKVAHLVGAHNSAGIGMDVACASVIAQLQFATALVESGRARHVLCTQSHLISRANPMAHPASPIVGDAATALVVGPTSERGVGMIHMVSHGEYHDAVTWVRGRDPGPPWYRAGEAYCPGTGNREQARMLSKQLVRLGARTIQELLDRAGRPLSSIAAVASVQPRKWIPAAVAETLGAPASIAPDTFDDLAHIGGCGVVMNLHAARRRGMIGPGKTAVLYAMGAGITRAAALVDF